MKVQFLLVPIFAALLCASQFVPHATNGSEKSGTLLLTIESSESLEADLSSARIFLNGAWAGNYTEQFLLRLSPGSHVVAVHLPRVTETLEEEETVISKTFQLYGEEAVSISETQNVQYLVFDLMKLTRRELEKAPADPETGDSQ